MREAEIRAMQGAARSRDMLLFEQVNFLNMRMTAFEMVSESSTIWQRAAYFFSPSAFLKAVDKKQLELRADAMQKAEERAKGKKLTIVSPGGHMEVVLSGLSGGNGKDHA